jgi:hypothetical protein
MNDRPHAASLASGDDAIPAALAGHSRRTFLLRGGVAAASLAGGGALYAQSRTDTEPRTLNGQPMPSRPPIAAQVRCARVIGSALTDKVAVVTGAARGIGRAIAVEFAANGAAVVVIDIAAP